MQGSSAIVPGRRLGDSDFALFRNLIYRHCGINLTDRKRRMVESRLQRRLHATGSRTYHEYYRLVSGSEGGDEFTRMIDAITTNKTEFFRDPEQFVLLDRLLRKEWHEQPLIRVASLGCSTGEEPYTVAMVATDTLGAVGARRVEIHALDICTEVLAKAREGIYGEHLVQELDEDLVRRHFLQGTGAHASQVQVVPELRSLVRFRQANLMESLPFTGQFDAIFCRNVTIYFDIETQQRLYKRILAGLRPRGMFFMGSAESLVMSGLPFRHVQASVYRKVGG